jgi:Protein of unknown function (DUF3592).
VGFTIYFFAIGNSALQLFLFLAIGVTIIGIPVLLQRYKTISSVFANGEQTKGVITSIGFFRGRGSVGYSYSFHGEKLTSSNAINRNSHTRNLRVGQTVKVFVDPDNPKRAFIQEIYM